MLITQTQSERAYEMAAAWANDHERLAGLLRENITPEQWADFCERLAVGFAAYTCERMSREATLRECQNAVMHIHALVVEQVFLPIAEKLVAQSEQTIRSAAEQYEDAVRQERMEREMEGNAI